jgi:hypothetical protein
MRTEQTNMEDVRQSGGRFFREMLRDVKPARSALATLKKRSGRPYSLIGGRHRCRGETGFKERGNARFSSTVEGCATAI